MNRSFLKITPFAALCRAFVTNTRPRLASASGTIVTPVCSGATRDGLINRRKKKHATPTRGLDGNLVETAFSKCAHNKRIGLNKVLKSHRERIVYITYRGHVSTVEKTASSTLCVASFKYLIFTVISTPRATLPGSTYKRNYYGKGEQH